MCVCVCVCVCGSRYVCMLRKYVTYKHTCMYMYIYYTYMCVCVSQVCEWLGAELYKRMRAHTRTYTYTHTQLILCTHCNAL